MQAKKIKTGEFYAFSSGSRTYSTAERIKILDTAHVFQVPLGKRFGVDQEFREETGILAVKVDERGEPKRFRYRFDGPEKVSEPFRINNFRYIWHTWAEQEEIEAAKMATRNKEVARQAKESIEAANLRDQILSLLTDDNTAVRRRIADSEPTLDYHDDHVRLDLTFSPEELLVLLKNARTAALNEAFSPDADGATI